MADSADKKTIVVTGAAGFLGRYIAKLFFEKGWQVVGIDMVAQEHAPKSVLDIYWRTNLAALDLPKLLAETKPDALVHCAGSASVPLSISDPANDFNGSVGLTFGILNQLREHHRNCRFILLSSAAVYGSPATLPIVENSPTQPISPYGFHKLMAEQLCAEFAHVYQMPTAALRIFSAYGAGLRRQVIWDICRRAAKNEDLVLQGTGLESRDLIHASDVALAVAAVIDNGELRGEAYNIASGQDISIRALATTLLDILGSRSKLSFDQVVPPGTPSNWVANIDRIKHLKFTAETSLADGLKSTAAWCKEQLS